MYILLSWRVDICFCDERTWWGPTLGTSKSGCRHSSLGHPLTLLERSSRSELDETERWRSMGMDRSLLELRPISRGGGIVTRT